MESRPSLPDKILVRRVFVSRGYEIGDGIVCIGLRGMCTPEGVFGDLRQGITDFPRGRWCGMCVGLKRLEKGATAGKMLRRWHVRALLPNVF